MRAAQKILDPFYLQFLRNFTSLLSWEQLDEFWNVIRGQAAAGWYVYAIGEAVPTQPCTAEQVNTFLNKIDPLLRKDHQEDYCGIVYTDSKTQPTMIKIFDPYNLGAGCGSSGNPPLPGWVMSLLPPAPLEDGAYHPEGRKRWWQKIWE